MPSPGWSSRRAAGHHALATQRITHLVRPEAGQNLRHLQAGEGGEIAGGKSVIVEDVVTSGGQIIESARQLRELGAQIVRVVCVIDREQGGRTNLQAQELDFSPLFTMSELKEAVQVR